MSAPALSSNTAFDAFLQQHLNRELLRFSTAGSVDDGKSTLIGRLLHDSKSIFEDQLAAIRKSRVNRSGKEVDLSLLTDGLKAEREQGITIDVAYRYFSTPRRKFIIADSPGHEQYTRNMATGASTADLSLILIDASKGLLPQSRRHTYISALLGTPHVVAVVNKMDLVGYQQAVFEGIEQEFRELATTLGLQRVHCIPISALEGDNVVHASAKLAWYKGAPLLEYLETVPIPVASKTAGLRLPVQYVIRPDAAFRGFAGQIAAGTLRAGDEVLALPSGRTTHVRRIVSFDGDLAEAQAPMSITVQLEDEIDLSRGDLLVKPEQLPQSTRQFEAMVVWMRATPMLPGHSYLLKHTTRMIRAVPAHIDYRVDVNTLQQQPASQLELNDIASVRFHLPSPIFFDPYAENRTTGAFILVDPITNATVAAGMIVRAMDSLTVLEASTRRARNEVTESERHQRSGHAPYVIASAAHAELSVQLERALFEAGFAVLLLRGEEVAAGRALHSVRLLRRAGVISILSSRELDEPRKREIQDAVPQAEFIDLDKLVESAKEPVTAAQVITSIRELRQRLDPDGEIEWHI